MDISIAPLHPGDIGRPSTSLTSTFVICLSVSYTKHSKSMLYTFNGLM